ncbi:nodulation protein NfeD [Oryzomonas sagensis]|uniref:Nodulation protein NfeD n=1 Tax=Oryzomonas sagensis TaxID=2603857 RepID=A0ABQ6TTV7_9BACT|nr:nodulation protein NfeD [Oryzomonas sagensis]KAB0672448.1 nodulation protein NfeD [Oryzomonas sagensis]
MRFSLCILLCLLVCVTASAAERARVRVVTIRDPITPVTAQFLHRTLNEAARSGDSLVLVELDTPGGLDTAMREIVKDIFTSPVPLAVYVAPPGARAASAGAIICLAADVCAMSPGTNIGAAHPVSLGEKPDKTMEEKVLNDAEAYAEGIARKRGRDETLARRMVRESISLSADRALASKVIDLIARDRADLLHRMEGRSIMRDGREAPLRLAGAETVSAEMRPGEQILNAISNPNVAYVLMMLGMLGLFFELSNPGVILPGVIGGISLILAFFAFQTLPVNYAGALLILLALVLFIAEIKVVSHGMLTVGGMIAMVFGSLLLFESPEPYLRVSWSVILVTVLATAGFFSVAVAKALRVHRQKPATGAEGLLEREGRAESAIAPEGKVFVNGEYWDAWSDQPIAAGSKVAVEKVEGMRLKVRKTL